MKHLLFSLFLFSFSLISFSQNTGIGVGTTTPHPSAAFEVKDSARGFLPPRLTNTQRDSILNPAEGLQIYNQTTKCLQMYSYGVWQNVFCAINPDTLPATLANGLKAFFPLDGNAIDLKGDFNGSITGAVNFTSNRLGVPNSAMQGGGGYITAPSSVFQFTYNQDFSLSIWLTTNGYTNGRILSTENYGPNYVGNFRIGYYADSGKIAVQFGSYLLTPVVNNQWTHLVWTNSNGYEKVYINGQLAGSQTESAFETLIYGSPFTIGAMAVNSGAVWNGKIDDVGIWNRVLSDQEIAYLYSLDQFVY